MTFFLCILLGIFSFLLFSFFVPNNNSSNSSSDLVGGFALTSSSLSILWICLGSPTVVFKLYWFSNSLSGFSFSFLLDPPAIFFSTAALIVTWSIVEFSHYYMTKDQNKQAFYNTLILFLFFMLILVSSNSLFLLFIGWEGVGILSFTLIGWWFTRSEANSAAIQAIIYNRIGDSGFILFLGYSALYLNSWDLNEVLFINNSSLLPPWAILGIIIAAAGKSAQFGLHPWLPSAMEGPTPVSALLHSSTMVVAGVFLLFRTYPLLTAYNWALPLISLLGALTALFAASIALTQYDIKKIIAYSTTSQLGLMIVAIGLSAPNLALFHICTHAFFKALLFLCSGNTIHSLNNEQDIRKISSTAQYLPFTASCITIGSLALSGLPFLAGYYSKDLILETCQNSISNSVSVVFSFCATLITALYSFRMISFINTYPCTTNNSAPISEENHNLIMPLLRLILGIFVAGWLLSNALFNEELISLPILNKTLPLLLILLASTYIFNNLTLNGPNNFYLYIKTFLNNLWFFPLITHNVFFYKTFQNSLNGVLRSLDQGWTSIIGPTSISTSLISITNIFHKSQTGIIIHYISYSLILIGILISLFLYN
uniref:NADH-ubiquinone oxidoreductase chain 5 n=1 Tax=Ophioceres incipiens TaxID=1815129 RepID=A0A3G2WJA8_9ECHI|nr:NADH dehydrogenase subunit 5 [Ophioceres incipiens]AYO99644.1 NADH dehydrogenase subunit 5 [Ophioceres incipiens]